MKSKENAISEIERKRSKHIKAAREARQSNRKRSKKHYIQAIQSGLEVIKLMLE